ncbi:MAG: hypothetical protein COZ06_28625 [Armatimonadetes bacterium CG_4_10_14_3_um_filter_66_18]|nr:hypothetical protein [Armatimonadota bacterium]OIO92372.1 MAG: hypothetical protein AUJ96_32265 [Armatimonadetes bacterium CG2_30_66_41]PIU93373.1 MAG: hypothetical protein COS65_13000 [Armatimonadetes bacterium CG06_land_8_20_14_3_00_66_21]PIX40098.1 MAG: hypothetical protein COZ57_26840 [Armatimonadetes bacterium CG_4_8_14_3_um_filter_66_20]PIY40063.1 MAG: hypothetical protein COZ06_28625 [Armatimonadetes bacterium CG_4_10_14_3_um_filter_66_18]PJB72435.1 MAG: hypothetical protein CO096_07
MNLTSNHLTGFAAGVGAAALGFYLYKKNQRQVDEFLRSQGLNLPGCGAHDPGSLTLEELVAEKERLEDLIAEREMAVSEPEAQAA